MSLLGSASSNTDQADLAILAIVETIRDQEQPATASAVASLIGGAPVLMVLKRLWKMNDLGLVEMMVEPGSFQLTELGCELMRRDMVGWTPSLREEARRQLELRVARDGLLRSRLR